MTARELSFTIVAAVLWVLLIASVPPAHTWQMYLLYGLSLIGSLIIGALVGAWLEG